MSAADRERDYCRSSIALVARVFSRRSLTRGSKTERCRCRKLPLAPRGGDDEFPRPCRARLWHRPPATAAAVGSSRRKRSSIGNSSLRQATTVEAPDGRLRSLGSV